MNNSHDNSQVRRQTNLRSRSFDKRNYRLTKRKQQKIEEQLKKYPDLDSSANSQERNQENLIKKQTFNHCLDDIKQISLKVVEFPSNRTELHQDCEVWKISKSVQDDSDRSPQSQNQKPPIFSLDQSDKKNYYMNMFENDIVKDSLQLESLFYQLSKHDFQRTPITQCSPILAYYLFSILLSYRQPDQEKILISITYNPRMKQIFELIQSIEPQLDLFFRQQNPSYGLKEDAMIHIKNQLALIQEIENDKKGDLNYQLVIDDFLLYQNLYKEKENGIKECILDNIYGKNNICLGFLRFIFYEVQSNNEIRVRIPVGQFDQQNVVNSDKVTVDSKIFQKNPLLFSFRGNEQTLHSEILMFLWVIQNQQVIANLLQQNLENKYKNNNNFQMAEQLYLKEVYFEITSEKRVCQQCVDKFPSFPTLLISNGIVDQIKSEKFTIQVSDDFILVILSQYLLIPNAKASEREQKPMYCKGKKPNKDIFYFETDCVGIMTREYLIKRYMNFQQNNLFTQQINCIKPTNTFFLSEQISDTTSSQQKQNKQQQPKKIKIEKQFANADIHTLLSQTISKIQWGVQKQQIINQKEGNVESQQTLLCFQLIKLMIETQIQQEYILWLISPEYISYILRQVCFESFDAQSIEFWIHVTQLVYFNQIQFKLYQEEFENLKDNILKSQNIFDSGFLNMKLALCDYLFMRVNSTQPLMQQIDLNQPNLIKNFGLFKINIIFQDSCSQTNQEIFEIQINKIDIDFTNKFTQLFPNRQQNLYLFINDKGIIINKIVCFIITLQQLSLQYKQWIEQQINLGIQIDYYYSYFRKLQPLSQQVYKNEEQYLVFDVKNLENRYSIENADYQVPLVHMQTNPIVQLKYFDEESIQQSQLIQQQGK